MLSFLDSRVDISLCNSIMAVSNQSSDSSNVKELIYLNESEQKFDEDHFTD